MKFAAVLMAAWCAALPAQAATVAIIDRSPASSDNTAAVWETLTTAIAGFDSTTVIGRTAAGSALRALRLNLDMATPADLSAALGVQKLLNISIRIDAGHMEVRNRQPVKIPGKFVIWGRLYDVIGQHAVTGFADSCADAGSGPTQLVKIMAWTLAPQLAPTITQQRAALVRDSLRSAPDAPLPAAPAEQKNVALVPTLGASEFWDIDRIKQEIGIQLLPSAEDYPNNDGVVLYQGHQVAMQLGSNNELYSTEAVHVITRLFKNIEQHTIIDIPVYDGQELTKVVARTIKPDGSVVKLGKKDVYLIKGEGEGAMLYSDTKTYRFTFAGVEKNAIVEYHYVIRKEYAFRRDQWLIQDDLPVVRNCYQLTVPQFLMTDINYKWSWNYRSYNYPDFPGPVRDNPELMETDHYKAKYRFTWDLRNIPAFEAEPKMPPGSIYWSRVRFTPSTWKTWNDIALWFNRYFFKPQLEGDAKAARLATELTAGIADPYDKAEALFHWVGQLRYIAISLGDGGYQPAEPDQVLERKYGDCKDKSTLLIAMLRSQGLAAEPVLVLTADDGAIDPSFPSLGFNHMIVKTTLSDGSVLWMDPTVKYCTADRMPAADQAINVLVVHDDNTGTIERTPGTNSTANGSTIHLAVNLNNPDTARFSARIAYHGEDAIAARYLLAEKPEKEMAEYCKGLIGGTFANAEITRYEIRNIDSLQRDPELAFDFTILEALQPQGDLLLLAFDPFRPFGSLDWLRKKTRRYPIAFECPRQITKSVVINYPADRYSVRNAPKRFAQAVPGLRYAFGDSAAAPGALAFNESYQIESTRIAPDQYERVLQFYDAVQKQKNEKIIFTKAAAPPPPETRKPGRKQR